MTPHDLKNPLHAGTSRLLTRFDELSLRDDVAVLDEEGTFSFKQLSGAARTLARQLQGCGLRGRRVALASAPNRQWVTGFWAIQLAGSTAVPLSPLHPQRERERLLAQSRAGAALYSESAYASMATPGAPALVFGDDGLQNANAIGRRDDLPGAITQQAGQALEQRAALLLYTSGTTARPKGVALTHRNVFSGVEALINAWGMNRHDTLIHTLPLHHLHGICAALLSSLCAGGATHFIPRYEAPRVLDLLAGASVLMGVPTQHKLLLDHIANCSPQQQAQHARDLRRLRLITSGSAKLPESIGRRLQALSGQYPLERYGMTEVGIVLSNPLSGERRPGSCGSPLPGCDVRIVDEGGHEKAAGEAGEIWIRGDSVFAEYDADPDATDAAFDRGFFKSGDTARWTADGFVEILGRTSVDIIKSGGYKLSAIEIEEELRAHPWVNDVAVVGCADEKWGQRAIAVIVPSTDGPDPNGDAAAAASQALRVWLKERLAPYKVPRAILWRSALPRNALGKVQKTELKAEVALLQ